MIGAPRQPPRTRKSSEGRPAGSGRLAQWAFLLVVTIQAAAQPAWTADEPSAASQRAHYSLLCRTRKDVDSCSDAVRWGPGDPALIVALADALVRAGRLQEALRDYRRAKEIDPNLDGIDVKIDSALAKSTGARAPKPPVDPPSADQTAAKHYSNVDPEAQSH